MMKNPFIINDDLVLLAVSTILKQKNHSSQAMVLSVSFVSVSLSRKRDNSHHHQESTPANSC
ncbi:hypothetical protein [Nonlabens spongiae]|uniref:hypothetical protein n=1 Tax=Nonlabens spongiae TaxID=331648 RepID=UPI0012F4FE5E|nr:hypothetical protein [Nonlabens spongiae]